MQKVFPEAATAGNNQDNRNGSSSDESEDNDYDPDCPEVDERGQGDKSISEKSGESDESDFTSASDDMVVPPNDKQCLGFPSDDSEDDDYDPDSPEIDEQVKQGSSSSDFTSDSEDFSATLDCSFSNKEDGLDGQRKFGRKKKETLRDELLSVLESNSGQDNAPASAKRQVERLDYKKLHDVSAHDSLFSSHASSEFTNLKIRFMHNIIQNVTVSPSVTI